MLFYVCCSAFYNVLYVCCAFYNVLEQGCQTQIHRGPKLNTGTKLRARLNFFFEVLDKIEYVFPSLQNIMVIFFIWKQTRGTTPETTKI